MAHLAALLCVLALASPVPLQAADQLADAAVAANPIRKVVTMLSAMQKKVASEGEAEKELYDKFMCYCKTNGGSLKETIAAAEVKAPSVSSNIETAEGQKAQLQEDLKGAQVDRSSAKTAMAEASAIREKEAAAFAADKSEYDANIAALDKAATAVDKGMAGFLQTEAAQVLRRLDLSKQDMADVDRQDLAAFLSGSSTAGYVPKSGQISGILKGLSDDMTKTLAELTATESAAIKSFEALMSAKTKEVAALSSSVETKTTKIGDLGVEIVEMKGDLSDTEASLLEDRKFMAELEKGCSTKTAEWEERSKTRAQELVALSETIKLLNDDDALDLFKKTLPSASASFMQMGVSAAAARARALSTVRAAQQQLSHRPDRAPLDLIALALSGKKVSFGKVIKMIDEMSALLKKEQQDDEHKKEYCAGQFDASDDKKKDVERTLSDEKAAAESAEEAIAALKEEIATLEAGIAALDKAVAEATEQRKEENKEYSELIASNSAAKQLLGMAKNRLNKFYNPALYKPPAKVELSREDKIVSNFGGAVLAQVSAHVQHRDAPPPPPATFGAYTKKSGETTGVIEMIDLLVKDLDKEMTEAETSEKDSQADYETMMSDSAAKRTADAKALAGKGAAKADTEMMLEAHKGAADSAGKELMATLGYIQSLHAECDWLLKYFDVRKEARAGEVDSLARAKAVLSGSDYALVQTRSRAFMGRRSAA